MHSSLLVSQPIHSIPTPSNGNLCPFTCVIRQMGRKIQTCDRDLHSQISPHRMGRGVFSLGDKIKPMSSSNCSNRSVDHLCGCFPDLSKCLIRIEIQQLI